MPAQDVPNVEMVANPFREFFIVLWCGIREELPQLHGRCIKLVEGRDFLKDGTVQVRCVCRYTIELDAALVVRDEVPQSTFGECLRSLVLGIGACLPALGLDLFDAPVVPVCLHLRSTF